MTNVNTSRARLAAIIMLVAGVSYHGSLAFSDKDFVHCEQRAKDKVYQLLAKQEMLLAKTEQGDQEEERLDELAQVSGQLLNIGRLCPGAHQLDKPKGPDGATYEFMLNMKEPQYGKRIGELREHIWLAKRWSGFQAAPSWQLDDPFQPLKRVSQTEESHLGIDHGRYIAELYGAIDRLRLMQEGRERWRKAVSKGDFDAPDIWT